MKKAFEYIAKNSMKFYLLSIAVAYLLKKLGIYDKPELGYFMIMVVFFIVIFTDQDEE